MDAIPYSIESAGAQDIEELLSLLADLFTIEQDFQPDRARQSAGLRLLLASPSTAAVLVARTASGQVIGMVTAQLVISTAEGAPSVWVEDLVVAQPHRGHGLGRRLLEAVLQWAQTHGATRAQLLADIDNDAALGFYERLGWHQLRMHPWRRQL